MHYSCKIKQDNMYNYVGMWLCYTLEILDLLEHMVYHRMRVQDCHMPLSGFEYHHHTQQSMYPSLTTHCIHR